MVELTNVISRCFFGFWAGDTLIEPNFLRNPSVSKNRCSNEWSSAECPKFERLQKPSVTLGLMFPSVAQWARIFFPIQNERAYKKTQACHASYLRVCWSTLEEFWELFQSQLGKMLVHAMVLGFIHCPLQNFPIGKEIVKICNISRRRKEREKRRAEERKGEDQES